MVTDLINPSRCLFLRPYLAYIRDIWGRVYLYIYIQSRSTNMPTTLRQALAAYLEVRKLRPRTVKQYARFVEKECQDWLDIDLVLIDRHLCLRKYRQVAAGVTARAKSGGIGQANGLFRILRALFKFSEIYFDDIGKPLVNPVLAVRSVGVWSNIADRTSVIEVSQLRDWYRLLHELPSVDRDYFLVLLLTGARFNEIAELSWSEVDLDAAMIHIPPGRTKGKKWHHQPLSRQACSILRERKTLRGDSLFVFSTIEKPNGPYSQNRRAHKRVQSALGATCNPHTLRRTFATIARNNCGLDSLAVKRCLNHSTTDITERYMQNDPQALRKPFQIVSDYLFLQMRGEKPRIVLDKEVS